MRGRSKFVRGLLEFENAVMCLIFPPFCVSCCEILPYRYHDYEIPLCPDCQKKWEEEKQTFCVVCGKRHTDCNCGVPLLEGKLSNYLHLARYTPWDSVARRMTLMAKDHGYNSLYRFITRELTDLIRHRGITADVDRTIVTAIPRNPKKVRDTGVDQGVKTARMLAKELGLQYVPSLKRREWAKQQKELSAEDRIANARSALRLRKSSVKKLCGKDVILYDDVITTGASMARAVELLRDAGVKKITVLTFSKTVRDPSGGSAEDDLEDSFGDFDIDA